GDDAPDAPAIQLDRVVLVGGDGLDDQLDIRGDAQQIGNHVGRACQEGSLEQDDIGGVAFNGCAQIRKGISLSDDPQIVFKGKYLANANPVNGLRIRKDNADSARLYRRFVGFTFRGVI